MPRVGMYPDIELTKIETNCEIEARQILCHSIDFLIDMNRGRDIRDDIKDSVHQFLKEFKADNECKLYLLKKYLKNHKFTYQTYLSKGIKTIGAPRGNHVK